MLKRICFLLCASLGVAGAQSLTVLDARRVGNNVEGMTLPDRGRLKGDIVLLDGDEVRATDKRGRTRTLFNIRERGLVTDWTPRGIAWVGSERRFVFHDLFTPFHATNELVFFDENGLLDRRVEVVYPEGAIITNIEGMTYIPASSGVFPDHLVTTLIDENFHPSFIVIDRDGAVVDRIFPDEPVASTYAVGIGYAGHPDRLVVSLLGSDDLYEVGFDGSVNGPFAPPIRMIEAVAEDHGHFVVAAYSGEIARTRRDFSPTGPRIDASTAPGVHRATSVAHDGGELVFLQPLATSEISVVPDDLSGRELLFDHPEILMGLTLAPGLGPRSRLSATSSFSTTGAWARCSTRSRWPRRSPASGRSGWRMSIRRASS